MSEDEKRDDDPGKEENKDHNSKEHLSKEEHEKELKKLIEELKELEKQKASMSQKKKRKQNLLMIEFGVIFHRNIVMNFLVYFLINMLLIYSILTLFQFGTFDSLLTLVLFVAAYTVIETIFRNYLLMRYFRLVIKSFGFIVYFGYLTTFYILNVYLFPSSVVFFDEATTVIFVGMFILFRFILTKIIRQVFYMR